MLISSEQNDPHEIYTYLNEGDKLHECYSCLEVII